MTKLTFSIIFFYFLIGAIGILLINKKNINYSANKERWIKYFAYIIIVNSIVLSILSIKFHILAFGIIIIGLYEIITVWRQASVKLTFRFLSVLFIYSLFSFCFIQYSFIKEMNEQLFVYMLVLTFDGFSQITGQLFGKNKLIAKISPNKTTEGVFGGLVTALITAILLKDYLFLSMTKVIGIALMICMVALTGDILASYYKRFCNVKDYSNLIPGHGGILDRFDSFIAAGAFYWIITLF